MARAKFKTIIPKLLPEKVFQSAFENASREMERDVKGAFADATAFFKTPPVWRGYVRIDNNGTYISVGTQSIAFKYYDEGNGGPTRIIRPVRASVLHWVDPNGEDVFVKWVHGYEGKKVSESITAIWQGLMPDYFDKHLQVAIKESGHAI
jgi:hypothetical protein